MPWVRVDCTFDMDPKILKLGVVGRAVIQYICRAVKLRGDCGRVSPDLLDKDALKMMCGIDVPDEYLDRAIDQLFDVGLIVKTKYGLEIPQWKKHQTDTTAAERKRRERDKYRVAEMVTRDSRDVTVGHGASRCHAKEEKRREENKKYCPEVSPKEAHNSGPDAEIRDSRAETFLAAMRQNEILVRGSGRGKIADSLKNPVRLANHFSDETIFPGLTPAFLGRAAAWIDASPRRAKKDIGRFLLTWASREKPEQINNKPRRTLE